MKALLLAAGLGTRLRPLTEKVPKCLVDIGGKPLLQYHLDLFEKHGITEILINKHYLAKEVEDFLKTYKLKNKNLKIHSVFEPELLGSAGTLRENGNFFQKAENFLVSYADNLTNINYSALLDLHKQKGGLATIAVYKEGQPQTKGVVEFDGDNKINKFIEKPKDYIGSAHANAGVYIFNANIFSYLNEQKENPLDFGHHLFPLLLKTGQNLFAYKMNEFLLDIGNMESYAKAQELIKLLNF